MMRPPGPLGARWLEAPLVPEAPRHSRGSRGGCFATEHMRFHQPPDARDFVGTVVYFIALEGVRNAPVFSAICALI